MTDAENTQKLNELHVGMTVKSDIVNEITGQVIVNEGSVIDEKIMSKIVDYRVAKAALHQYRPSSHSQNSHSLEAQRELEIREQENKEILNGSIPYLAENERQTFIKFKNAHDDGELSIKRYFSAISEGKPIDVDVLYEVTTSIMSTLAIKSDLFTYIGYLKKRDQYTYAHSLNLSLLCNIFGRWLGFPSDEIKDLTVAGLLHDLGNMKIDLKIIKKQSRLTQEEFEEVKKHTIYGFELLRDYDISKSIKLAVLQHHERIDGSGYPYGIKNEEISKLAKIIAICDVYEAMVSIRPYRDSICPFTVIKDFEQNYYGKLDTEYLMTFLKNIAYNYLGRTVRLKSGQIGEIVFINNARYSAPIVQLENGNCVDLLYQREESIARLL